MKCEGEKDAGEKGQEIPGYSGQVTKISKKNNFLQYNQMQSFLLH